MQFGKSGIVEQMYEFGHGGGGGSPLETVFCCYAHSDNESANPKERWLDRFLEILKPLVRQMRLDTWSDREIKMGEDWHARIQARLVNAKAVVLFVSPAFLASEYIANSELPVLLHGAKQAGVTIFQILLSPCLWSDATYKFPDPTSGPNIIALSSLQAANSPSQTLVEMTEAEQNRVFIAVAGELNALLVPKGA